MDASAGLANDDLAVETGGRWGKAGCWYGAATGLCSGVWFRDKLRADNGGMLSSLRKCISLSGTKSQIRRQEMVVTYSSSALASTRR